MSNYMQIMEIYINHQINWSAVENKLTYWFDDKWGKHFARQKTPLGDFHVTTPNNSLINSQVVTSIKNLITILAYHKIPTYSWTFTPISNWTWSFRDFFLYARISVRVRLPNNWCSLLDAKFFTLKHVEDLEVLGYKTQRQTRTQ